MHGCFYDYLKKIKQSSCLHKRGRWHPSLFISTFIFCSFIDLSASRSLSKFADCLCISWFLVSNCFNVLLMVSIPARRSSFSLLSVSLWKQKKDLFIAAVRWVCSDTLEEIWCILIWFIAHNLSALVTLQCELHSGFSLLCQLRTAGNKKDDLQRGKLSYIFCSQHSHL